MPITKDGAQQWIESYGRAWRERDPEAAATLFADDGVYRAHPMRAAHKGREAVRDYWSRATATQGAIELQFGDPVVAGARSAVEWWAEIEDTEAGWITISGILMLRFDDFGLCAELRECWHEEAGRHGPPEGWGR